MEFGKKPKNTARKTVLVFNHFWLVPQVPSFRCFQRVVDRLQSLCTLMKHHSKTQQQTYIFKWYNVNV